MVTHQSVHQSISQWTPCMVTQLDCDITPKLRCDDAVCSVSCDEYVVLIGHRVIAAALSQRVMIMRLGLRCVAF